MRFLWVAIAGAGGAVTRYAIGLAVGAHVFPWATMGINITGSFVLAFLVTAATERRWPETLAIALTVGFVGAYTTFSTFSWETLVLLRTDRLALAAVYAIGSFSLGLLAAWGGYTLARAAF